jgi:hypothetical protein
VRVEVDFDHENPCSVSSTLPNAQDSAGMTQ